MRLDQLYKLMARAKREGALPSGDLPNVLEWDVSGTCQTPVRRLEHARGESRDVQTPKWRHNPGSASLIMTVPCRKCEACMRFKAQQWYFRAREELRRAPRTWFGSLTMSPENHFRCLLEVSQKLRDGGTLPSDINDAEMFRLRSAWMGARATEYFKTLRKTRDASFRYVLVTECHKSGLPHLHLLLHETDESRPVRKTTLQEEWTLGFSSFKLVDTDPRAAGYVTKYISKSMMARVRASIGYGEKRPDGTAGESRSVKRALY